MGEPLTYNEDNGENCEDVDGHWHATESAVAGEVVLTTSVDEAASGDENIIEVPREGAIHTIVYKSCVG